MEIVGKKIAFLGDSVTEGAAASAPEKNFVSLMRSVYGAQALNYGAGGTRIARQKSPSENPVYDEDFLLRADKTDKGAEIIAVFGGTNDYGHGDAPLGTAADDTPYTFYGAVNCLYEKRRLFTSKNIRRCSNRICILTNFMSLYMCRWVSVCKLYRTEAA